LTGASVRPRGPRGAAPNRDEFYFMESQPHVPTGFHIRWNPEGSESGIVVVAVASGSDSPTDLESAMAVRPSAIAPNHFHVDAFVRLGGVSQEPDDAKKHIHNRRRFLLLGQTPAGMQVYDIRRTLRAVQELDSFESRKLILEGHGDMAVVALYASLFEPNIAELRLYDLPASHTEGPDFLNVLRSHDIPAAVAMAAERCPVRITTNDPQAWDFPRQVADKLGWNGEDGRKPRVTVVELEAKKGE
jgi:hypothetical protein